MTRLLGSTPAQPLLPPLYRPASIDPAADPFVRAVQLAAEAAGDGTLLWSRRLDRLACAIVLRPDLPLAPSLPVAYVALLGLGDALGALLPPMVAVTFGWPDRIEINGGLAGGVRLAAATAEESAPPDWLVVGIDLAVAGSADPEAPGRDPGRTSLQDEGGGDIDAPRLLESFARHFLAWMNRWQDDGFAPVRSAWLQRAPALCGDVRVRLPGRDIAGRFAGIDELGRLLLTVGGMPLTVPLAEALQAPSWRL